MTRKGFIIILFLLPTFILFILVYAIPLATVLYTSFFNWKGLSGSFKFIGLANYMNAFFGDETFRDSFFNTMAWVLLQCTVHVSIGAALAVILSKKVFGWKFIRTVYMTPNIISAAALGVIFLNFFNPQIGVVNSVIRMLGAPGFSQNWFFDRNTAFFTVTLSWLIYAPLVTILVMAEIASIPQSVYESSRVDGATSFQMDCYITLPLLRNILGTCMIIAATSMLKEFELIFLTTKGGPGNSTLNLPLYLYKTSLIENNYGYANMMGTVLIILGIASILCITKLFRLGESDL